MSVLLGAGIGALLGGGLGYAMRLSGSSVPAPPCTLQMLQSGTAGPSASGAYSACMAPYTPNTGDPSANVGWDASGNAMTLGQAQQHCVDQACSTLLPVTSTYLPTMSDVLMVAAIGAVLGAVVGGAIQ